MVQKMLKVENLTVKYGEVVAAEGIAFHVDEGEMVSILGANGAGKTTTLYGISGMIESKRKLFFKDRVSGSIKFKGVDIAEYSSDRRVKMGLVLCPENRRNFPELSVEDNLRMGAYSRGDFKENIGFVYQLFPVLKERRKGMANFLSGGEQQMLAVGRALMSDPALLMLDEPSLGLAPVLVDEIFRVFLQLRSRGVPVLLVEQNAVRALKISDRSYILETGRVVHSGNSKDLLEDKEIKRAYLGM